MVVLKFISQLHVSWDILFLNPTYKVGQTSHQAIYYFTYLDVKDIYMNDMVINDVLKTWQDFFI